MRTPLALLLAVACGGTAEPPTAPDRAPDEAPPAEPAEPRADAPARTPGGPPPIPEGFDGVWALGMSSKQVKQNEPVTITFVRPGPNGCYQQSEVTTTLGDHEVVHSYTTSSEGEMCSQQLVPGGFEVDVTPTSAGPWTGRVIVDDREVTTYIIEVSP